jgi:hypothetical protein
VYKLAQVLVLARGAHGLAQVLVLARGAHELANMLVLAAHKLAQVLAQAELASPPNFQLKIQSYPSDLGSFAQCSCHTYATNC